MTNEARKNKRQNAWNRRQKEKEANKAAQKEREKRNIATKRAGGLTPHELSQQRCLEKNRGSGQDPA